MKTKPAFRLAFPLASAIAMLLAAHSAQAAVIYWDPASSGSFGSVDGTITWASPLNLIWTNSSTGGSTRLPTYTTSTSEDCNFGGPTASLGVSITTPGTTDVIPVSTVNAGTLSFNTLGNNLTLLGGTITLKAASSITTVNASQSHTITSVLAGAATSLTKAGAGTLILSGANTYAGTTIINVGTLNLGGGTANGSLASTALTLGGGGFSYTRTGNTTQGFTNTNITSGRATQISVVSGNTLDLGTVVRGAGGALDFSTTGAGTVAALAASNTNGIMAGLTFGDTWAVANGAGVAISGLASYTLTSVAGTTGINYTDSNMDVDSSEGLLNAAITTNSLRFSEADANTMTLATGPNTITTGGILVNTTVGGNLSTITGGTLTGVANGDLALIQNNTSGGLTISSGIVNTTLTSVTKSGAGLLTLGGNNTFTGGVFINAGTVALENAGALNSTVGSQNAVTFGASSTATLALAGNSVVVANLSTSTTPGTTFVQNANGISVANATLTVGNSSNLSGTFAGIIRDGTGGGTLALTKAGTGTLTLPGANTYSGGTTLTAGTVAISNATSFGSNANVAITGSSRINATGNITYGYAIDVGAALTMQNPATTTSTATFSGILSGASNITLPNSGTNGQLGIIAFTNTANTFTGNVILSSSSSGDEFFSFNSIGDAGNFTFQKNGNRQGIIYAGATDIVFNTRQINIGTTFSGGTTSGLDGGGTNPIMAFQNNGAGAVTFNTNMAMTTVAGAGVLFFDGSNAGNNTFAGTIGNPTSGGSLGIGKYGSGTWILSNSNTYAGNTQIFDGILSVNAISPAVNAQPLGVGSLIWLGNRATTGTLRFTGATNSTTDKQVRIGGNVAGDAGGGRILNNGSGTLTFSIGTFNQTISGITATRTLTLGGSNTGANTISGTIQNNAVAGLVALTKADAGTWVLSGPNTYSGGTTLSLNGGTLSISHASALGTGTVQNGTTNSATIGSILQLNFAVPVSGPGSSASNPNVIANNFTFNSQNLLASSGFANIQNVTGFNRINGTLTIIGTGGSGANIVSDTGNLELAGNLTTTVSGPGNRAFNFGGAGNGIVSGIISNGATSTVPITKSDAGTWTLTNANTYTGATTVSAGMLLVNSPGSLAAGSAVAVNGGTLGGTGTIGGTVTVAAGGSLAPGASPGTLTIGGGLDISAPANGGTGKLNFELDALANTNDKIAVTGTLTIGIGVLGFNDFVFTNLGGLQVTGGTPYKLITSSGITALNTLDPANLTGTLPGGLTGTLQLNGGDVELAVTSGGSTYATWIADFPGVGLLNGVNDDPDFDGIDNAAEMVLGGNPATGMDTALLPTIELVTNPVSIPAIPAGNYLLFTYRRTAISEAALVAAACETDTDLVAPWTTAVNAVSGVVIQEDLNYLLFTPAAPADTDRVRVYVPRGANTKLFGRLNVVVP